MPKNDKKKDIKNLDQQLILNKYILGLFGAESLETLVGDKCRQGTLNSSINEGFDEDNISKYCQSLCSRLFFDGFLTKEKLLEYDQNIYRFTKEISEKRNGMIHWKYFQYMALIFTEIYLDLYFNHREEFLGNINRFATDLIEKDKLPLKINANDNFYNEKELSKLAFWMATGSGKTLILHINIKQYLHYSKAYHKRKPLNKIILLTPNEGLSRQHEEEFFLSGITCEMVIKNDGGLFANGGQVKIIDVHKLKDESKEKTIAVDSFEGNNLVLVDEGHRGMSGKEWKSKRDKICKDGFSFEYSATFSQAIKQDKQMDEYAKCILFNYSYKYFYQDGYGKYYKILNYAENRDEEIYNKYLTACLLSFYQQTELYLSDEHDLSQFLVEKPLWVFVGGSVTKEEADVLNIIRFINSFISEKDRFSAFIDDVLKKDLVDSKGGEIFKDRFTYLISKGYSSDELYDKIFKLIFNGETSGSLLHLDNLKKQTGEIGLRCGNSDYFGVINVGDDSKLLKLCDENGLNVSHNDFSDSLFNHINKKNSKVNLLIGSRKFTEGWNSWRVSTMGLLNLGRSEGSQIIQLFGRGIRLKGFKNSLKRSELLDLYLKNGAEIPKYIKYLETLNIFGVRADYMAQFKDYLEQEGIELNFKEVIIKTIKNPYPKDKLKVLKLTDEAKFKAKGPKIILDPKCEFFKYNKVIVDWYPKIQALGSGNAVNVVQKDTGLLSEKHLAFLDLEEIYFEIIRYKNEKRFWNLSIKVSDVVEVLKENNWYTLLIPAEELNFDSMFKAEKWQAIAISLLKKFVDKYYNFEKANYESDKMEYVFLNDWKYRDDNIIDQYVFSIKESDTDLIVKLEEMGKKLAEDHPGYGSIESLYFDKHLYKPLIHIKKSEIDCKPIPLVESEAIFIKDLKAFYEKEKAGFLEGKDVYLLRNQSRGKGVGFFDLGGFYPDFILWVIENDHQTINFIDPKGIRNLDPISDPKLNFYKTIKEIEQKITAESDVTLNSFVLSGTKIEETIFEEKLDKKYFEDKNILFQDDANYIEKLFSTRIVSPEE